MEQLNRVVVCAAMKMLDGHIVTGVRHYSSEMRQTLLLAYGSGYFRLVVDQGFIDQNGYFLTREEAWKIAEASGQIRREVATHGVLYSENLY